MKRRITATLVAAITGVLVAACGGPSLTAGHVIARQADPGYYWLWMMPIYGSRCSGSGSTFMCTEYVMSYIPIQMWQPPDWRLELKDGKLTGWTYVSEQQYERARMGQWWGSRNANRPAAVKAAAHRHPA